MSDPKPVAVLIPVQLEIWVKGYVNPKTGNVGPNRPRWVDGYKVKTPEGSVIYPFMRKKKAREYCKAEGWQCVVGKDES